MSGVLRTVLAGMLGLGLLEAAVSSTASAGRAGGLLTAVATCINRVLDPTVAAIPDLRKHGGAAKPTSATAITPATLSATSATPSTSPPGSLIPGDWSTSAAAHYV
jgi:hypothetical protein